MNAGCTNDCPILGVYEPDRQEQRFCERCTRWFHLGCLNSLTPDELGTLPSLPEALAGAAATNAYEGRLLSIPIKRGMLSGISGNGHQQIRARKRARHPGQVEFAEDVEDRINEDYIAGYTSRSFFRCPLCQTMI